MEEDAEAKDKTSVSIIEQLDNPHEQSEDIKKSDETHEVTANNKDNSIVLRCLYENSLQFFLDCSVLPNIINAVQQLGPDVLSKLFHLTRNYCYTMHKTRLNLLLNIKQ